MLQKDILIDESASIKDALKKLDNTAERVLLVSDKKSALMGTITDGDIRRYLLKGKSLEDGIREVYHRKPQYVRKDHFTKEQIKKLFLKYKIDLVPVLDDDDRIVDYISWNQIFANGKKEHDNVNKIDVPVVIMAGGKGTRMDPFTRILPKPLIPINDKPMLEIIIEEFKRQGSKQYYLILNYKAEMIEAYFNGIEKDYKLNYIHENEFLGTAGGLKLIEKDIGDIFMVSNCDIIVKADLAEVISLHKKQHAWMTVLSSIQHYKIPYGVVNFKEQGAVIDVLEKPEYTFTINTGVYVLSKESLKYIHTGTHFDMTDLIKNLIRNNKKIITYPVNESNYIDIGQWEEYKRAVEKMQVSAF